MKRQVTRNICGRQKLLSPTCAGSAEIHQRGIGVSLILVVRMATSGSLSANQEHENDWLVAAPRSRRGNDETHEQRWLGPANPGMGSAWQERQDAGSEFHPSFPAICRMATTSARNGLGRSRWFGSEINMSHCH
jgi:hypothetical protein